MSSSTGPEGSPDLTPKEPAPTRPAQPSVPDRTVMEEVLKRTLNEPANSLEAAEREALLAVVRRYRTDPFELDPVVVDLVEVLLRFEFDRSVHATPGWRRMCYEVAKTLFEDPVARERLQNIWTWLCGNER